MSIDASIDRLRNVVRRAPRITILTGAGVSAASGIPTFRGVGGLWKSFRAEDLATSQAFARDPRLVWEWYDWRRQLIVAATPNAAHEAIATLTARPGTTLVTQNVDGLHERAGSANLLRLHGSIWRLRCWAECDGRLATRLRGGTAAEPRDDGSTQAVAGAETYEQALDWEDLSTPLAPLPPQCPHCGGLARPAVVWFGERLDPAILGAAREACGADLFLSVGTSSLVHPAAGLVDEARRRGAVTAEINPDATPASGCVDIAVAAPAELVLPRLVE